LKIAYDNQIFFFEKYGGISRYYTSLLSELIKTEYEYKIFSSVYLNEYLTNFDKKIINGFKFEKYPPNTTTILNYLSKAINYSQISIWKPDIIHETFYSFNRTYSKNIPVIITIHDMIHELYPEMFNKNDKTTINKKRAVDRADRIICVSETTKQDLIRFFNVPENKISVINHGFTTLKNSLNNYKNSIDIPDLPYLLYIGKRGGYKNFDKYLHSISISKSLKKDFKLFFFGGGEFTKNEMNLFSQLGFSNVNFAYFEGDDDLLQNLLTKACAFIYPSLYEGFGLPLLEAMECECPIVASNTGSIPEIAKDAAEYFDPSSIVDIGNSIKNVVYSNERTNVLKHNSKLQIKNYSWEKAARLTNIEYENLT
jgi:glycosyltransferase involved in cell wall biosynthesis